MNALGRDIEKGEKVVLKKDIFKPEYQDLETRTVTVLGGFGTSYKAIGSAVFVEFSDGEKARYEGSDIDREETEALKNS